MAPIHAARIPRASITFLRKVQSTLSYTFQKSNIKQTMFWLVDRATVSASEKVKTLSMLDLSNIKLVWLIWIRLGMKQQYILFDTCYAYVLIARRTMFLVFIMHIDLDERIQDPLFFEIESVKKMTTRASDPWLPEYIYFERNHSVIRHVASAWR